MKPYIERTREALRRIYDAIGDAGLADKVAFGVVAFRSSVEKTQRIEYVSRVISDFKDGHQRAALEHALAGIAESRSVDSYLQRGCICGSLKRPLRT